VLLGLGIFLTIFGLYELETCKHSMLVMYLLVTGCTMVAGCGVYLLGRVILLLSSHCQDSSDLLYRQFRFCLVILFGVFFTIWWIAGCYWTWGVGWAGCVQRVYIVALCTTIAPIICVVVFFYNVCKINECY